MSRSRKKLPITGVTTAESDKRFKKTENGRERAGVRVALAHGDDMPSPRLYGDPALSEKDGKLFWRHPRALRK